MHQLSDNRQKGNYHKTNRKRPQKEMPQVRPQGLSPPLKGIEKVYKLFTVLIILFLPTS